MKYNEEFERKAELLKVIAHPVRLCIIRGLMESDHNVTDIQTCLGIPQSTVSQHLSILRSKGIIKGQRNGLEIRYTVVDDFIKKIINLL